MSGFWIGMTAVILLVVALVAVPVISAILPRLRAAQGQAQPAAGAQAPAADHAQPLWKNPLLWVGIIITMILWFTVDRSMLLGAGVLVGLAVLAFNGKGGLWAKLGLVVLGGSLLLFGSRSPEVLEKVQKGAAEVALEGKPILPEMSSSQASQAPMVERPAMVAQPKVVESKATWKDQPVGVETLPVGVWSDEAEVRPGCRVNFAIPPGTQVQYRHYSVKWRDYVPGSSPEMSNLRWKATEEGVTEVPYTIRCS